MIKIDKDLNTVPNSLNNRKTITRRNTLIRDDRYHDTKEFNQRFKQTDIKEQLNVIYNSKCAYCEEKITKTNADNLRDKEEQSHTIEHYRPKSKYPWLAYSWDNLLWCCVTCNKNKDNNFNIENEKVMYEESFLDSIHKSNLLYNDVEKPKMIHPEFEDITDELRFDETGKIYSEDDRVKYTIACCAIDRLYLQTERKKVLDDLLNKIKSNLSESKPIQSIVSDFQATSLHDTTQYKAFRKWIISDDNLSSLIVK